jgi:large subunit ribosomal protein L30
MDPRLRGDDVKMKMVKAMATKGKTTKAASGKKTLTVIQTGSSFHGKPGMKETLIGLGLGKPHARRILEDTPAVRGMICKVQHLVAVEGE